MARPASSFCIMLLESWPGMTFPAPDLGPEMRIFLQIGAQPDEDNGKEGVDVLIIARKQMVSLESSEQKCLHLLLPVRSIVRKTPAQFSSTLDVAIFR